ncbi:MAG: prolipoprotein diacylglyceryl transferase [Candidatus Moraniibacteriota bacterium]
MREWWQHIPQTLDPIALTIGFFSVRWYALWLLAGFFAVLLSALWLSRNGKFPFSEETVFDMLLFLFFGAVIGGHIGYVLFYNFDAFLAAPYAMLLPYDFERGVWVGISGMSYHGGLIGAALALYWFARRKKIGFWQAADGAALLAPMAISFGRMGNFFNIELYGRLTERPWGMIFPGVMPDGMLRHPSTLYEAFFEGIVLLILLILLRKRMPFPGALACVFLAGYAILRFLAEYFREPDAHIGFLAGGLTLGQIFSAVMLFAVGMGFLWLKRRNRATIAALDS